MENKALERWRRNRKIGSFRRALIRELRIMSYTDPDYLNSLGYPHGAKRDGEV